MGDTWGISEPLFVIGFAVAYLAGTAFGLWRRHSALRWRAKPLDLRLEHPYLVGGPGRALQSALVGLRTANFLTPAADGGRWALVAAGTGGRRPEATRALTPPAAVRHALVGLLPLGVLLVLAVVRVVVGLLGAKPVFALALEAVVTLATLVYLARVPRAHPRLRRELGVWRRQVSARPPGEATMERTTALAVALLGLGFVGWSDGMFDEEELRLLHLDGRRTRAVIPGGDLVGG